MPPDWGYFNDDELIERAFLRYAASGYTYIPSREEVASTDHDWETDVLLRTKLQRRQDFFAKQDREARAEAERAGGKKAKRNAGNG
jgi:hypothetical protein